MTYEIQFRLPLVLVRMACHAVSKIKNGKIKSMKCLLN